MRHTPVLLEEAISYLNPKPNQNFIDGTVGQGGHSGELLRRGSPHGKLLGFDKDPEAIRIARENLGKYKERILLVNDNYTKIKKYGRQLAVLAKIHGILLDLGVSSAQMSDQDCRGFSFKDPEKILDMRMDPADPIPAYEILNKYSERELERIFKEYGEERYAKEIARNITKTRRARKILKVGDLLEIIDSTYKNKIRPKKIHPATKAFQALRIEVNQELRSLEEFLPQALEILERGGRIAIISFHSLEDRIVKEFFKKEAKDCLCPPEFPKCVCQHGKRLKILTKKPIIPSEKEILNNIKARSAKLRVAEKIN